MTFFESLRPDYYGWGQHKDTPTGPQANGPFAFAGSERDARGNARGWSAGAGLLSGQLGDGARADVVEAQGHFGGWRDELGRTNVGVEGDAAVARFGLAPGHGLGPFGFDVGVLDANAVGKFNEDTASLGAGANLIEGSATLGNQENSVRLGGSIGVGLGGRLHYGDADHDGIRELGFGLDVGPVSFDIKSELLGRAANAVGDAGSWIGNKASGAWDAVTDW